MLKGTIKSGFRNFGKTAGRKLSAFQVVPNAVTAHAFAGARVIAAVAIFEILFFFAFHISDPCICLRLLIDRMALRIAKSYDTLLRLSIRENFAIVFGILLTNAQPENVSPYARDDL